MKSQTYTIIRTVLRLEGEEVFVTKTQDDNEFAFEVNQITWTGGDYVEFRGPGLSRKGQLLHVYRTDTYRHFNNLPQAMQDRLASERADAIMGLMKEIKADV